MTNRPKITFKLSSIDITLEILSGSTIASAPIFIVFYYPLLPEVIPIRFDSTLKPILFGDKGLLIVLLITHIITYTGLSFLVKYPHIYTYPWPITASNALVQYMLARTMIRWFKFLCGLMSFVCYYQITVVNTEYSSIIGVWMVPWVGTIMWLSFIAYLLMSYVKRK